MFRDSRFGIAQVLNQNCDMFESGMKGTWSTLRWCLFSLRWAAVFPLFSPHSVHPNVRWIAFFRWNVRLCGSKVYGYAFNSWYRYFTEMRPMVSSCQGVRLTNASEVCTHADLPVVCNYPSWRSRGWSPNLAERVLHMSIVNVLRRPRDKTKYLQTLSQESCIVVILSFLEKIEIECFKHETL